MFSSRSEKSWVQVWSTEKGKKSATRSLFSPTAWGPLTEAVTTLRFSRQEYWSGLPFPSPVDHVLSELPTMNHPSWVALYGMAHDFIELDKSVVHVISLISFLWLQFSFCLPFDEKGLEAYGSFLMGETFWGGNWVLFWWAGLSSVNI